MNTKDKIGKAAWAFGDACKDTLKQNVIQLARGGQLKIDERQQQLLLTIIDSSVDQAMHQVHKIFLKSVEKFLVEESGPTK